MEKLASQFAAGRNVTRQSRPGSSAKGEHRGQCTRVPLSPRDLKTRVARELFINVRSSTLPRAKEQKLSTSYQMIS